MRASSGGRVSSTSREGPGEVVAVVIQADICVLAGVEAAAVGIGGDFGDPRNYALGDLSEQGRACGLVSVDIVPEKLRVVVGHLFEVGDYPAFVYGVAVKASPKLVIDAAEGHLIQGLVDDDIQPVLAGGVVSGEG